MAFKHKLKSLWETALSLSVPSVNLKFIPDVDWFVGVFFCLFSFGSSLHLPPILLKLLSPCCVRAECTGLPRWPSWSSTSCATLR